MKQNIAIGLAVLAVLVSGAFALWAGNAVESHPAGALAGPDIASNWLRIGGVESDYWSAAMTATSSSPCIFGPIVATSTVDSFTVFSSGTGFGGTVTFDISTTTTSAGNASSTPAFVKAGSIPTTGASLAWKGGLSSTTQPGVLGADAVFPATGLSSYIVFPNQYVTVRIATGTPQTFSSYATGVCKMKTSPIP